MIYILPPPRCTYGEWRLSSVCAPTLKERDYKDPLLVIEIDDDFTIKPDAKWNMQDNKEPIP